MPDRKPGDRNVFPIAHRCPQDSRSDRPRGCSDLGRLHVRARGHVQRGPGRGRARDRSRAAGGVAYLMDQFGTGVKGKFACKCQKGKGNCNVVTSEGGGGNNPGLGCDSDTCTDCLLMVTVPTNQLAPLTLRALDIQLERGSTVVGDIRSEAVITSDVVRLGPGFPFAIEQGDDGVAYLAAKNGGVAVGEFNCFCKGREDRAGSSSPRRC